MKKEELKSAHHRFYPTAKKISLQPYTGALWLSKNAKEEVDKRWENFVSEKSSTGVNVEDKYLVCTDFWGGSRDNTLQVFYFQEAFKNFVTSNPAFTYSDGMQSNEISGVKKFYSVGACGLCHIDGSYMLLGIRCDGRIDTVPAGFLQISDLKEVDPVVYAFRREGKRNSVEPDSVKEHGVIISDYWRNLSACFEGITEIKKIKEDFNLEYDRKGKFTYLKRKHPKETKYRSLFLCPEEKLEDYASKNLELLGDRTKAILGRYFEQI